MEFSEVFQKLGLDWRMVLFAGINFLVFFLILQKFVITPVSEVLKKREKKLDKSIRDAEQLEKELENAKAKADKIIKEASAEANEIVEKAKDAGKQKQAALEAEARKSIAEMEVKSQQKLKREKQSFVEQLRKDAADLALKATHKILGKKLDKKSDKEFIDQELERLEVK